VTAHIQYVGVSGHLLLISPKAMRASSCNVAPDPRALAAHTARHTTTHSPGAEELELAKM